MSSAQINLPEGKPRNAEEILDPWKKRRSAARKARKPFEGQWMTNQAFAAGNQHVEYLPREHRVIDTRPRLRAQKRSDAKVDVLTQYLWTAIGKFAKDDFRPQFLFEHSDEEGEDYASGANQAFGWGWDEEWHGDEVLLDLLLTLVTFGTAGLRCRYDRTKGPSLGQIPHAPAEGYTFTDQESGQQYPFKAGQPILHEPAARDYVASAKFYGEDIKLKALHEGAVVWELLSPWNLLPPPAVENSRNFPWHLIVRPVHLDELRQTYGDAAKEVQADELEGMNILGLKDVGMGYDQNASASSPKLEEHALVYTGYEQPCPDWPQGATVVFTHDDHVLDFQPNLPYNEEPHGARCGITYFHYWKVKQRFFGRALIEPGIGPQRIFNKREAQNDEIIDRGLPKVYVEEGTVTPPLGLPLEEIALKPGAPRPTIDQGAGPGPWMAENRNQQLDNIERALGLHSVSVGESNAGATAPYARLALETENDADKLDPIAKDLKLGVGEISRDSLEAMRNWPDGKVMLIGGENDRIAKVVFARSMIPSTYMVRPAKGGALPRSQGAEVQKINDLWSAAVQSGAVVRDPIAWLDWYKTSLDDGKTEQLPTLTLAQQQRHKAALENVVMARTGQVLPVADYDDDQTHIGECDQELMNLAGAASEGDQQAYAISQVIEQHRQMHVQKAQAQAAAIAASQSGGQPPIPPGPSPFGQVQDQMQQQQQGPPNA